MRLDKFVYEWICAAPHKSRCISGAINQEKWQTSASIKNAHLEEKDIIKRKFSVSWFDKFKKIWNGHAICLHGENGEVGKVILATIPSSILEDISRCSSQGVLSCDEAGLSWQVVPDHIISNHHIPGRK